MTNGSQNKNSCIPIAKRPRKSRLEKEAGKITPIHLQENLKGESVLYYCVSHHHPGVIGSKVLEEKNCLNKDCINSYCRNLRVYYTKD